MRGLRGALGLVGATALLLAGACLAQAELTASGDLFVHFDGAISPQALPRRSLAPVAVRIEGAVKSHAGATPPALRSIEVAVNRNGRLDTEGLPRCGAARIAGASPAEALGACGRSLVGAGGFTARTDFSDQSTQPVSGQILLFNARAGAHPTILAHVFQSDPAPITNLVVFHIRHTPGTFGIELSAKVPAALDRNGQLTSIYLRLHRHYSFRGRAHDYLSAGCPAPRGFPGAVFPFARVAMGFADGRRLSATLVRSCRARG